jgi:hypothetical protein
MAARRLIPFLLALAVAFAPVALEACEASCAMHAALASRVEAGGHQHQASSHASQPQPAPEHDRAMVGHCHEPVAPVDAATAAPSGGPVVTATAVEGLQTCSHADALPVFAGAMHIALHAPAVVPAAAFSIAPPAVRRALAADSAARPPGHRTALTTQLRV